MYILDNLLRVSYYEMPKTKTGSSSQRNCAAYSEPPNELKVLVEAKFKRARGFVIPLILLSVATHEQIRKNKSRFTIS